MTMIPVLIVGCICGADRFLPLWFGLRFKYVFDSSWHLHHCIQAGSQRTVPDACQVVRLGELSSNFMTDNIEDNMHRSLITACLQRCLTGLGAEQLRHVHWLYNPDTL